MEKVRDKVAFNEVSDIVRKKYEITEADWEAYTGLTAEERAKFSEIMEFIYDIIDTQCEPWVVNGIIRGRWWPTISSDGNLELNFDPDEYDQSAREALTEQVFAALERTPNRYFTLERAQ